MSNQSNSIFLNFIRNVKNQQFQQLATQQQLTTSSQKHIIQSLELDGLIAHSSTQELIQIISLYLQQNQVLPQQCQLELFLLDKYQNLIQSNKMYQKNEKIIKNNQKSLQTIKLKISDIEKQIAVQEKQLVVNKTKVEDFKNQGLKMVLNQNKRLEFELQKYDHQLNNDLSEQELKKEILKYKRSIKKIKEDICGEHEFPMTKSEALTLVNKLEMLKSDKLLQQ